MFLYRSNRIENLVEALARVLDRPLADPLARESIVVEGRGIERWLERQLADRLGVWANAEFPFPRHFVRACFDTVLGTDDISGARFEPETLAWSIAAVLPELRHLPAFDDIDSYLAQDEGSARLLALSREIARVLDQYVTFRPAWIAQWERGRDEHWQAVLWRRLVSNAKPSHLAARAMRFIDAAPRATPGSLPERVCLFGISTLAPLYLHVLEALSPHTDVHLFVMSPSSTYWGHIKNKREVLRQLRLQPSHDADIHAVIDDAGGNPLLASFGTVGRDFQENLESETNYNDLDIDLYSEPGADCLLKAIQTEILQQRPKRPKEERLEHRPDDVSIQRHRCHSPIREVQVLRDQLLQRFAEDTSLAAHDVVVLCPTIDEYAPLIDAVFGSDEIRAALPFRIADSTVRNDDDTIAAYLRLLTVLDGRFTAVDLVDLLELHPVRARFGISEGDGERITTWVRESGIRWGADAAHRAASGQPELAENTWQFGLERLFLGFALAPLEDRTFAGRLPALEIDATSLPLLGALSDFCEALSAWREHTREPRSPADWLDGLMALLDALIVDEPDNQPQRQELRESITALADNAGTAGFTAALDLATVRTVLEQALASTAPGRGFSSGAVTFCAFVPMRSVPFRVVCLLGMNDETFPRKDAPLAFDLIARSPRQCGDRSGRTDDLYLFLEALLSARERLIITHVGRSVRDNTSRPPSVVVEELFDFIDATFVSTHPDTLVSKELTVDHPLQPYSPHYFDGDHPHLFSYATEHFDGARALAESPTPKAPFVFTRTALEAAQDRAPSLSMSNLIRFLQNPARAFLQQRLGIYLRDTELPLESREPIEFDAFESWQLGDAMIARAQRTDEEDDAAISRARAAGLLPPGAIGVAAHEAIREISDQITARLRSLRNGTPAPPVSFSTEVAGHRITGVLDELWPSGLVAASYSKLRGSAYLDLWVRHLFLCLVRPDACTTESHLVARGEKGSIAVVKLRTADDPHRELARLIDLYLQGQRLPLPLFSKASLDFARTLAKGDLDKARGAARTSYLGGFKSRGDSADPSVRLAFGEAEPLPIDSTFPLYDTEECSSLRFEPLSQAIYAPLFDHLVDANETTASAAEDSA